MPLVAGHILLPDRVVDGWMETKAGRIVRSGRGEAPEAPDASGWIVPSLVDAHTHVGDAFLRERPGKPHTVKELVGPGGWKHTHLAAADPDEQATATRDHLDAMAARGVAACIDFREGGVQGARWLRAIETDVQTIIHGRPGKPGFDEDEADALFAVVDGLGFSGLRDINMRDLEDWADAARGHRKAVGIHVSEDQRDDIHAAISLGPDYVVHMTQGKTSDFDELADARIPIVVCPRSNAFFGMRPPIQKMLDSGCQVALGTDNAMFHAADLVAEAGLLDLDDETRLRMMSHHARRIAGLPEASIERGAEADWIVLPERPFAPLRQRPGLEPRGSP